MANRMMPPILKLELLKRFLLGVVLLYAITVSVLLILNRPQFAILLLDESGMRRITNEKEVEQLEQFAFIKRYLALSYRYSAVTYSERIEAAKKMLGRELREERRAEFERLARALKGRELVQCYDSGPPKFDIRYVDAENWEVDLEIHVIDGLMERVVPLRVALKMKRRARTIENWNAWEVKSYVESQGAETLRPAAGSTVCGDARGLEYRMPGPVGAGGASDASGTS